MKSTDGSHVTSTGPLAPRAGRTDEVETTRIQGVQDPATQASQLTSIEHFAKPVSPRQVPEKLKKITRTRNIIGSTVAVSFAALLAVATSVPAQSLLSEAQSTESQISPTVTALPDKQSIRVSAEVIAPSVDREQYSSQTVSEYAAAFGIRSAPTFTNDPNGTVQWPFLVGVKIGDRFGGRDCSNPVVSCSHHGQDFNPGAGAAIQAIADGVVSTSTDAGGAYGVEITIDHVINGKKITSLYAHMLSGSRMFQVGDSVKVGEIIGRVGSTGASTGPHLHFEIRPGGVSGTPIDPLVWLYANTN